MDSPLWNTSPTKQQPWPEGNSSLVLICRTVQLSEPSVCLCVVCLSFWSVPVSLPVLFRNPLCSGYLRFLCFFDLCQCRLCSSALILYYRNLSAVGSVHPSGLGRAREGCGRGGYAARQSHLCKSVDNRGNDCRVSI